MKYHLSCLHGRLTSVGGSDSAGRSEGSTSRWGGLALRFADSKKVAFAAQKGRSFYRVAHALPSSPED